MWWFEGSTGAKCEHHSVILLWEENHVYLMLLLSVDLSNSVAGSTPLKLHTCGLCICTLWNIDKQKDSGVDLAEVKSWSCKNNDFLIQTATFDACVFVYWYTVFCWGFLVVFCFCFLHGILILF